MNIGFFEILLFIVFLLLGGLIGLRRLILLLMLAIAGYASIALYNGLHDHLEAFMLEYSDLSEVNTKVISIIVLFVVPFLTCIFESLKALRETWPEIIPDEFETATDKVYGAGTSAILFILVYYFVNQSW